MPGRPGSVLVLGGRTGTWRSARRLAISPGIWRSDPRLAAGPALGGEMTVRLKARAGRESHRAWVRGAHHRTADAFRTNARGIPVPAGSTLARDPDFADHGPARPPRAGGTAAVRGRGGGAGGRPPRAGRMAACTTRRRCETHACSSIRRSPPGRGSSCRRSRGPSRHTSAAARKSAMGSPSSTAAGASTTPPSRAPLAVRWRSRSARTRPSSGSRRLRSSWARGSAGAIGWISSSRRRPSSACVRSARCSANAPS